MAQFSKVKVGKGKGSVFAPEQLTEDLLALGNIIKEQMIVFANEGRKHSLLKSGDGFIKNSKVIINTDGIKLDLPTYAQNMDKGRRVGVTKVPIDALIDWIKRYRIGGRSSGGRFKKRGTDEILSLAYAIQNSIYKKGIKARPFLEKTIAFGQELVKQYLTDELAPQLLTVIDFEFNKK